MQCGFGYQTTSATLFPTFFPHLPDILWDPQDRIRIIKPSILCGSYGRPNVSGEAIEIRELNGIDTMSTPDFAKPWFIN